MLIVIIANAEIKLMQLFSQKSFNELATKHAGDRRNVTEALWLEIIYKWGGKLTVKSIFEAE